MIGTKPKGRRVAIKEQTHRPTMAWLGLWFVVGIVLGMGATQHLDQSTGAEITQYLQGYVTLSQTISIDLIFQMVNLYIVPVLVVFFLGYVSIGIVILPVCTILYAGVLSFSVSTLLATFGAPGLWVALAVLGIRTLVGIPCYMWIALQAHGGAKELAQVCLGVKKGRGLGYDARCYWGFFICLLILLFGVCIDCWLSPKLMSWALTKLI